MIRLFVAIDLPFAVRSHLHCLARQIHGARAVPADQVHLTLSFIGEVNHRLRQPITNALAAIESAAFTIALHGAGRFPPRGQPRVLWVGLQPQPLLNRLHSLVEGALRPFAATADKRQYSPHVTIARIKEPVGQEVNSFLDSQRSFASENLPVTEFLLYSSTLTAQGAIHRVEHRFPLID